MRRKPAAMVAALVAALWLPLALAAPVSAQPNQDQPNWIRMQADVSPRIVRLDNEIRVSGQITNISNRAIANLQIRVQRGQALDTDTKLTDRLAGAQTGDAGSSPAVTTVFQKVADTLEPGQSVPITLSVPIAGGPDSLRIDKPGVYQVVVNVNGTPDFGKQARLAAQSMLLPVQTLPGGPAQLPQAAPDKVTVLWPLVDDHPRVVGSAGNGQVVLGDDDLAGSLAPGGRLYGLVNTALTQSRSTATLLTSLCFALDPDLLQTVSAMAGGYQVRGVDGTLVNGAGGQAARTWLTELNALTAGQCVVLLPFGDADLVALSRAGEQDLLRLGLSTPGPVADLLKGAHVQPSVLWPADATLDKRTLTDVVGTQPEPVTVVVDPSRVQRPSGQAPYLLDGVRAMAMPVDPLLGRALRSGSSPGRATSVQDTLAGLVYRAAVQPGTGQNVLVAPPRRWDAPAGELTAFLDTLSTLFAQGVATPLSLSAFAGRQAGSASGLDYGAQDGTAAVASTVTDEIAHTDAVQNDLLSTMKSDPSYHVDPATLVEPVRYGLLRSASTGWRSEPDRALRSAADAGAVVNAIRAQVSVVDPGRPFALASGESPIPVSVSNALPVAMLVKINLGETAGLSHDPPSTVLVPAHASINPYVPAKVTRSGHFTVDVWLTTRSSSTSLGSPVRVELSSTSYGTITLVVTIVAGSALILMVAVRLFRRIRAARATESST